MYIARLLYPVEVLGPGKRVGIWFSCCPKRCKGCSNPELWNQDERYRTTPENIIELISHIARDHQIDGFTLTGGDPMYQYDDMIKLIKGLTEISKDIFVYTGYRIEELKDKDLSGISVLIDGAYLQDRNKALMLRGSDNQRIIYLDESIKPRYEAYLSKGESEIQNFVLSDGVVSVGIHRAGFRF